MGQTLPPFTRSQHSDEPTGGKGMKEAANFRQLHVKKIYDVGKTMPNLHHPQFHQHFFSNGGRNHSQSKVDVLGDEETRRPRCSRLMGLPSGKR